MSTVSAGLPEKGSAAPERAAGPRVRAWGGSRVATLALSSLSVAVAAAAVFFTWRRLLIGMDLQDESYYVLVPWRWALGDRPFVNEQNLLQLPGFLVYPFVKVFGMVRGYDVTGLVLYTRHLYLLLMIGVAAAVFLLARRLVRWQLALLVACVFVTYIFWATPQLSYNTLAIAFLSLSVTLGCWVVLGLGGPRFALASGVAFGLAVIAYPSLLFIVPFWGVLLAFALGRRAPAMIAEAAFAHPPDPEGPPTGRPAWRALSLWVLGGVVILVPFGLLFASFGVRNLWRSWQATMAGAQVIHQLGGAAKAIDVAQGFWRFYSWRPLVFVVALVVYLVYRRWPRVGRGLLGFVPVALWFAAQRPLVWGAGYVLLYALLVPYLYLFVPRERREQGARLLIWAWAPSLIAGAMNAYTSANGYYQAAVGLAPAVLVGGVFLCWALEAISAAPESHRRESDGRSRGPSAGVWLAATVLVAVVAVTVAFQFQFQQRDVPRRELTSRFTSGPWWGIKVTPERHRLLDTFAADLTAQARPDDQLLVFFGGSGYYLYWPGSIAANGYWLWRTADGQLPQATVSYYRRHRLVPTLVCRIGLTDGASDAELMAAGGGLDYPPTLVRPTYVFLRKPSDESTATVLAGLPRVAPK
jgi:hypothetical protein